MPISDTYFTISEPSEGFFKDRASKFYAFAFPMNDENSFKDCLEEVKKKHPKARHHCFAYRIGMDDNRFRASDDGEPSGSAGKPILNVLLSKNVRNVLIIVSRYFGGTLLGVPGLINAYKMAGIDALNRTKMIERTINQSLQLSFEVRHMNAVMRIAKKFDLTITSQDYSDWYILNVTVRLSLLEEVKEALKELRFVKVEMVNFIG